MNLYLFAKGSDGALWYTDMSLVGEGNTWAKWASLGGQLTSSPCAVSRSSGYLDVYVRGTDGAIWEMVYYSGAWYGWYPVGGQVAPGTGPGASGWPGREDVFAEGTDGALWQKTWTTASGWTNWASLGGQLTSSPAAVSRGAGLIDVHVRGADGADWYRAYVSGWQSWEYVGGVIASGTGPALSVDRSSTPHDIVDLFVTGTDGAVWQKTETTASGWWSSWTSLGGNPTSSPTAAWSDGLHGIELYVRWNDGFVWQKEFYADSDGVYQWHIWQGGDQAPP
jgi:hypothetical protein